MTQTYNITLPDRFKNHIKHLTASGYVLNSDRTKVLLLHHKKLGRWLVPGGHVDEGELPHESVVREIEEETGVKARFLQHSSHMEFDEEKEWFVPSPYLTMLQLIPANTKDPEHFHYDFSYILTTDDDIKQPEAHESQKLGWFSLEEVLQLDTFAVVPKICRVFLESNCQPHKSDSC